MGVYSSAAPSQSRLVASPFEGSLVFSLTGRHRRGGIFFAWRACWAFWGEMAVHAPANTLRRTNSRRDLLRDVLSQDCAEEQGTRHRRKLDAIVWRQLSHGDCWGVHLMHSLSFCPPLFLPLSLSPSLSRAHFPSLPHSLWLSLALSSSLCVYPHDFLFHLRSCIVLECTLCVGNLCVGNYV